MDQSQPGLSPRSSGAHFSITVQRRRTSPGNSIRARRMFVMFYYGILLSLLFAGCAIAGPTKKPPAKENAAVTGEGNAEKKELKRPFMLGDPSDITFTAYGFNGTWTTNGLLRVDIDTGNVYEHDLATGKDQLVLDGSITFMFQNKYILPILHFSTDKEFVLVGYSLTRRFRHSVNKKSVVYNIKQKTYHPIAGGKEISLAKWSPGKSAVAYVLDNDLYYQEFGQTETKPVRLTNNGVTGIIYNGIPDWVYEEEVLGKGSAIWFSEDGRYLAFATFDETNVKDAAYFYYGEPGSLTDQYPREVNIRYPKAGTTNPTVRLSLVDLTKETPDVINLPAPVDVVGQDHILYTVTWREDNHVLVTWTNRVQNKAQLVLYKPDGTASNVLYEEEKEGWLKVKPALHHKQYAILVKMQDSGTPAGKFFHATRFEYVDGKLTGELDLTPGSSEVVQLVTIDHVRERLYYLATGDQAPTQRNLYSVPINGGGKPECISCRYITPEGHNCTYASAAFSRDKTYFSLDCSGPDPTSSAIFDYNYKQITVWDTNEIVRMRLATRLLPKVKTMYIKANGFYSLVRLFLPHDFDECKKYPLLIHVYGAPNSAKISDEWSIGLQSYMSTNRSVVYGWIDGRGSSYRGSKLLYSVYRKLGGPEVEDQLAITKALLQTFPWLDGSKTGIWGWSYGGYSTVMALSRDKESVFKCGIAVAPVTSWIYYDSMYTERFMGLPTPEDNLKGYNESDATRNVEGIRGKKLLLIHGSGDDNVHFQQAMALAKVLEHKDILFEQLVYTDESHGLSSVTRHLYHTMDRFWEECLGLPSHY